jgi:hypothetical protein
VDAQYIIDVCEANWDANKSDCNHFVKAVASALGVNLFASGDDADGILNKLAAASGWNSIGDLATVESDAAAGQFIIAGLKSGNFNPPRQHGHVVVVVKGDDPNHPSFPLAYWGTLGGVGQKDSSIRNTFIPDVDLPNVQYYGSTLAEATIDAAFRVPMVSPTPDRLADARATMSALVSTIVDCLGKYSGTDQKDRLFFPDGIESIELDIKAGPVTVGLKIAGPKASSPK